MMDEIKFMKKEELTYNEKEELKKQCFLSAESRILWELECQEALNRKLSAMLQQNESRYKALSSTLYDLCLKYNELTHILRNNLKLEDGYISMFMNVTYPTDKNAAEVLKEFCTVKETKKENSDQNVDDNK